MSDEAGQTLLELIAVMAVAVLVVSSLTFATISSLRNAQLSKNQAQATKLAQEALEKVRAGRDRNLSFLSFSLGANTIANWNDPNLWGGSISASCSPCYFNVEPTGGLKYLGVSPTLAETISNYSGTQVAFTRVVLLSDSSSSCLTPQGSAACYTVQKTATAVVTWTDFSGSRESRISTVLRKL